MNIVSRGAVCGWRNLPTLLPLDSWHIRLRIKVRAPNSGQVALSIRKFVIYLSLPSTSPFRSLSSYDTINKYPFIRTFYYYQPANHSFYFTQHDDVSGNRIPHVFCQKGCTF